MLFCKSNKCDKFKRHIFNWITIFEFLEFEKHFRFWKLNHFGIQLLDIDTNVLGRTQLNIFVSVHKNKTTIGRGNTEVQSVIFARYSLAPLGQFVNRSENKKKVNLRFSYEDATDDLKTKGNTNFAKFKFVIEMKIYWKTLTIPRTHCHEQFLLLFLACHTTGLSTTQVGPIEGEDGGILLFRYSMIYVYGLTFYI